MLISGLGLVLLVSSPLRAAWRRVMVNTNGWVRLLPMLVSLLSSRALNFHLLHPDHEPICQLVCGFRLDSEE